MLLFLLGGFLGAVAMLFTMALLVACNKYNSGMAEIHIKALEEKIKTLQDENEKLHLELDDIIGFKMKKNNQ